MCNGGHVGFIGFPDLFFKLLPLQLSKNVVTSCQNAAVCYQCFVSFHPPSGDEALTPQLLWPRSRCYYGDGYKQTSPNTFSLRLCIVCSLLSSEDGHWKQSCVSICVFHSFLFWIHTAPLCKKKKTILSGIFISTSKFWIPPVFITSCGAWTMQNIKGIGHTGGFSHRKFEGFWRHKGRDGASGHGCYQTWVTYAPCCPWMHPFHIHYRSCGSPS